MLCREAIALNPTDAVAHSSLGTSLVRTGHTEDGAREIATAIGLDDKEPSVLWDAGLVAVLRNRNAEALDWLRKAVKAGYCREIIARQPEFGALRDSADFQALVGTR